MIVHQLQLENFCQHRHLEVSFTPGLNLLLGPNGSGKTNILRALQLLLTGDAGGDRNKADDIMQGIAANDRSFVSGEISHSGSEIAIRRSLRPNENSLVIGEQTWTTATEINAELWRRLGTTKKQIVDYIFVGQRKIDELFDQRPADRAAALAALFGLSHAEAVHQGIGTFLHSVEVPTTTLSEDSLRNSISQYAAAQSSLEEALASLGLPADPDSYQQAQQAIIDGNAAWERAFNDRRTADTKLQLKLRERARLATSELAPIEADIITIESGLVDIVPEARTAAVKLRGWETYAASEAAFEQYAAELAAHRDTPIPVPPAVPTVDILTDAEAADLHGCQSRKAEIESAIKSLGTACTTCKTCGQPLPGAADREVRMATLLDELQVIQTRMAGLLARSELWAAFNTTSSSYITALDAWRKEESRLLHAKAALSKLQPPKTAKSELQKIVDERAEFEAALKTLKEHKAAIDKTLAGLDGEIAQLTASLEEKQLVSARTRVVVAEEADEARNNLRELRRKLNSRADIREQHVANQQQLDSATTMLNDAIRIRQRGAATREAVQYMEQLRVPFHRNEAPRMVSYTYIDRMLAEVNRTLELFEAPFEVSMDDSLAFNARFHDGRRTVPDKRLSVGERIVLAMAFRITVNSTFAGQVGMLVMDEPTAGLDEHNLSCLPHALSRLRDLSHERGLQVLFVTHEPRITQLFDNTITLQAP